MWPPQARELAHVTRAYTQTGVMRLLNLLFALEFPARGFRSSTCLEAMPNWAPPLVSLHSCLRFLLISLKSRVMASPSVSFVSRLQLFFFFFSALVVTGKECSSYSDLCSFTFLSSSSMKMFNLLTSCLNRPVAVI